ncbi:MAG TPA: hypothetical protein VK843_08640 [Planctomycetota bacterium]|nr:hypothetical protein [Planctomycetota bacterium]
MTRRLLAFLFAIVPASLVSAQDAGLPKDFASLVPSDSFAVVVIRSTHELAERLEYGRTKSGQAGPTFDDAFVLKKFLDNTFPGNTSLVDATKPLGIAFRFDAASPMPVATFIVPAADPKALMTSMEKKEGVEPPVQAGNYIGIPTEAGAYKRDTASRLLADMPSGLVAARVDLAAVILKFRPIIDMGLEQAEGMVESGQLDQMGGGFSSSEVLEMYLEIAHDIVDSADLFDATTDVRDGSLGLNLKLLSREGSALAKYSRPEAIDYRALAGRIDPQAAVVVISAYDQGAMFERVWPTYESMFTAMEGKEGVPAEGIAAFKAYLKHVKAMLPKMGRAMGVGFDFGVDGMRLGGSYASPDPQGFLKAMIDMMRDPAIAAMGIQAGEPTEIELAGTKGVSFQAKFDMEKFFKVMQFGAGAVPDDTQLEIAGKVSTAMFGKDGSRMVFLTGTDRTSMMFGGDDAWRTAMAKRFTSGGDTSPALACSVGSIAGMNPAMLFQVDLGRGIGGVASWMALVGGEEDMWSDVAEFSRKLGTQSLPASLYWGASGKTWAAGASIDFEGLLRLIKASDEPDAAKPEDKGK